jgi:sialate O-acetylesterase
MAPRLYSALFAVVLAAAPVFADVQLARVFSDHMVLQAQRPVPVWGTAAPGERIVVEVAQQTKTTVAGTDGRWRVTLDPLAYAPGHAPQTIVVRGTNEIRVTDVLIGEVWLCSGQSNMRYALGRLADATNRPNDPAPFAAAIARSANPFIRLLNVSGGTPADQRWAVSGPTTTPAFSAIAYFFARDLVRDRGVPVGVVDLGKGGAPLRAFLPRADSAADPVLSATLPPPATSGKVDTVSGSIYEKEFRLFAPYAVRGLLWYQGEADAGRAATYPRMLGAMISRWRSDLESPALPVLVVQLPPYERRRNDPPKEQIGVKWAEMREAQWRVTQTIPQTHLAVIADLGERFDIHPRRKPEVASRLALLARARVYGEQIPHSGPLLRAHEVRDGKLILSFDHADGGLVLSQEKLSPLTVAGDDRRFVPAAAEVQGLDQLVITLPSEAPMAKYVRYAWQDYFTPGLFNAYGLPASPFRTDSFPLTTAPVQP